MQLLPQFYAFLAMTSTFLIPTAHACVPMMKRSSSNAFVLGDDGPADHATLGYTMNHFSFIVNDMPAMMHFYGKVLGMRHIFTYHATPKFEIVYMGYSHGGKNGTGYQTGEELYNEKTNTEGLLEFIGGPKTNQSAGIPSSTKRLNTFSHVGLVVPDTKQIEARLKKFGIEILKPVGEMPVPGTATAKLLEGAFGLSTFNEEEQKEALDALVPLGFEKFLVVTDPEGNVVEIQDQV